MTITLGFDPYHVLGVNKDADLSEIKTAHRKLVLRCHPDKIKDESMRAKAVDEFQRVQASYELLSDATNRKLYDQEVRLTALRREAMARKSSNDDYSSPRGTSSREYRDGRVYEERAPADAAFFSDSDEARFTEEPLSYSRKYDDGSKRKAEEKKKTKSVPLSTSHAKDSNRDYVKASHHDRAKNRTKERRRDASDKYERTTAAFVTSDNESGWDGETIYYRVKVSESRPTTRDSVPRRGKTEATTFRKWRSRRPSGSDSEYDEYEYHYESKLDNQESYVKEYISRRKDPIIEVDRRPRSSRSDRETEWPRFSSRARTRTETRVPAASPPRTSRRSHERLDSAAHGYSHGTPAVSPKLSSSRVPPLPRTSTMPYPRTTRRESSNRSESKGMPTLANMIPNLAADTARSRPRGERYDSGYSSPGTPEMPQGSPKVSRYKIVDPPETINVEPAETHRYRSSSPPPRMGERPSTTTRTPLKASRTYHYPTAEAQVVYEARPSASRSSSNRPLFGEVRYVPEIKSEHINPSYRPYPRRQSVY